MQQQRKKRAHAGVLAPGMCPAVSLRVCPIALSFFGRTPNYGLPVIGLCNYRAVITAVITCVITAPLSELPVIRKVRSACALGVALSSWAVTRHGRQAVGLKEMIEGSSV